MRFSKVLELLMIWLMSACWLLKDCCRVFLKYNFAFMFLLCFVYNSHPYGKYLYDVVFRHLQFAIPWLPKQLKHNCCSFCHQYFLLACIQFDCECLYNIYMVCWLNVCYLNRSFGLSLLLMPMNVWLLFVTDRLTCYFDCNIMLNCVS